MINALRKFTDETHNVLTREYHFLCKKDFWMEDESAVKGDRPAFLQGEIYIFTIDTNFSECEKHPITLNDLAYSTINNQGICHFMTPENFEEYEDYFELVGVEDES